MNLIPSPFTTGDGLSMRGAVPDERSPRQGQRLDGGSPDVHNPATASNAHGPGATQSALARSPRPDRFAGVPALRRPHRRATGPRHVGREGLPGATGAAGPLSAGGCAESRPPGGPGRPGGLRGPRADRREERPAAVRAGSPERAAGGGHQPVRLHRTVGGDRPQATRRTRKRVGGERLADAPGPTAGSCGRGRHPHASPP